MAFGRITECNLLTNALTLMRRSASAAWCRYNACSVYDFAHRYLNSFPVDLEYEALNPQNVRHLRDTRSPFLFR
jgi:hypothetical protein